MTSTSVLTGQLQLITKFDELFLVLFTWLLHGDGKIFHEYITRFVILALQFGNYFIEKKKMVLLFKTPSKYLVPSGMMCYIQKYLIGKASTSADDRTG